MQNNVETQHKHTYNYSFYIGLCNMAFPMARLTCIVTSQVFVKNWMQWSKALSFAFYRGMDNVFEKSSAWTNHYLFIFLFYVNYVMWLVFDTFFAKRSVKPG